GAHGRAVLPLPAPPPAAAGARMTALLEAERLSFAYGPRAVLSEVDLAVAPGELVGVIGPNGGGKTTLVRLLSGVLAPRAGSVRFKGAALGAYRRRELARRLAVVPQDPTLEFPFTALEVVLMGRAPHLPALGFPRAHDLAVARTAMARLDVAGLEDRPLDRLSGGERQRVLLARARAGAGGAPPGRADDAPGSPPSGGHLRRRRGAPAHARRGGGLRAARLEPGGTLLRPPRAAGRRAGRVRGE